jgi:hypothetical protein
MRDGIDLPDVATARTEAVRRIRAILEADAERGEVNLNRSFDIRDETGRLLLSVPFADALQ